jgi:hypothetical protein
VLATDNMFWSQGARTLMPFCPDAHPLFPGGTETSCKSLTRCGCLSSSLITCSHFLVSHAHIFVHTFPLLSFLLSHAHIFSYHIILITCSHLLVLHAHISHLLHAQSGNLWSTSPFKIAHLIMLPSICRS